MRLFQLLTIAAGLSLGMLAHADTFSYTLNGGSGGFSGTGTLTGAPTAGSNGAYLITAIAGTGVTGLIAPGGFNSNNNLLYPNNTSPTFALFDLGGISFTDQNSTGVYRVNLYNGGAYFAYVVDNTGTGSTVPVTFSIAATTVTPEPSSLALLGTGVLGVLGVARRRFLFTR